MKNLTFEYLDDVAKLEDEIFLTLAFRYMNVRTAEMEMQISTIRNVNVVYLYMLELVAFLPTIINIAYRQLTIQPANAILTSRDFVKYRGYFIWRKMSKNRSKTRWNIISLLLSNKNALKNNSKSSQTS